MIFTFAPLSSSAYYIHIFYLHWYGSVFTICFDFLQLLQMSYDLAEELVIGTCWVVSIFFVSGSLYVPLVLWILWWLVIAFLVSSLSFLAVVWAFGLVHRTEVIELSTFHTFFSYAGQFLRLPSACLFVRCIHGVAFLYRFVCSWVDAASQNVAQASSHLEECSCRLLELRDVSSIWTASVKNRVKSHFLLMAFCISDRFCVVWMRCSKIRSSQLASNSLSLAFSLKHMKHMRSLFRHVSDSFWGIRILRGVYFSSVWISYSASFSTSRSR